MRVMGHLLAYVLRTGRPRRWWLPLLPIGLAVVLGLISSTGSASPVHDFLQAVGITTCGVLLPLVCLITADTVLGAEIRSGAFALTWLSPAPIWAILLMRWLGGWLLVAAYVQPAVVVAALVAGAGHALLPLMGAVAIGSAAYLALFMLIGAVLRRAIAVSLAYVVVVERTLGAALPALAGITPSWLTFALAAGWAGDRSFGQVPPGGSSAVVRLLVISGLGLGLAFLRLRRPNLAAGGD